MEEEFRRAEEARIDVGTDPRESGKNRVRWRALVDGLSSAGGYLTILNTISFELYVEWL